MSRYAADTSVSSERSRAEIEITLSRYGADHFAYMSTPTEAIIGFQVNGRRVRFNLPIPDKNAKEFTHTPTRGTKRSPQEWMNAYEQSVRQLWRALALVIKAKLEAIRSDRSDIRIRRWIWRTRDQSETQGHRIGLVDGTT